MIRDEELRSSADYSEGQTEAARRVLVEPVNLFDAYKDEIRVVGGWVPDLMFPNEGHIGSVDVDLLINHLTLKDSGYQTMAKILLKNGYKEHPDKYFSFVKTIQIDGIDYDVDVDILAGMYGGTQNKKRSQHVQGIKALKATGGNLAFDFDAQNVRVEAKRPISGSMKLEGGRNMRYKMRNIIIVSLFYLILLSGCTRVQAVGSPDERKESSAANPGTDVVTDDYNLRIAKKIDTLSEDVDETMQPSTANLEGAHNGYFFIPINGEKYRYEVASDQRNQGSVDSLIYECSSDTTFEAEGTYEIYSLKEYPDYRFLQCKGNTNDMVLLEYSPSRKNTEFTLEDVEKDGFVVLKNGNVCYGEDIWDEFVKRTELGLSASVWICQCYENAGNSAPGLYEATKEDYPSMYLSQLYYDGTAYTISPMHKVEDEYMIYEKKGVDLPEETFRYMLHFVEEGNTKNVTFKSFDKYVLTNKEDVTWQQLSKSILSGGSDYIRFVEVFTKYEWKED